jgi:hypothetical protein
MEKKVSVAGDAQALWQCLLSTVAMQGYEFVMQNPPTQLRAKRGSKLSSMVMEGTQGGYRDLTVTMLPKGDLTEVCFNFEFPSWAMTLPGTKKECEVLVEEFVKMAGQTGQPGAVPAGAATCPACKAAVTPGAKFCGSCGAPMGKTCAKCGATVGTGAKFCDSCGAQL